jgi:hypothetical protein
VGCLSQLISCHIMSIEGEKFGGCACTFLLRPPLGTMSSQVMWPPTHPPTHLGSPASHLTTLPTPGTLGTPTLPVRTQQPILTSPLPCTCPHAHLQAGGVGVEFQEGWVWWTCMPR